VLTELIEDGEIERRERKYILLRGGSIEAAVSELSSIPNGDVPAASNRRATVSAHRIPLQRQHRWGR
jgi:hypothetical protein